MRSGIYEENGFHNGYFDLEHLDVYVYYTKLTNTNMYRVTISGVYVETLDRDYVRMRTPDFYVDLEKELLSSYSVNEETKLGRILLNVEVDRFAELIDCIVRGLALDTTYSQNTVKFIKY